MKKNAEWLLGLFFGRLLHRRKDVADAIVGKLRGHGVIGSLVLFFKIAENDQTKKNQKRNTTTE
jgi:hypothetical protein